MDREDMAETLRHEDMDVSEGHDEGSVEGSSLSNSNDNQTSIMVRLLGVHVIKTLIFSYLSPQDIKNTVLVCRKWKELVEVSCLWRWAIVRMNTIDLPNLHILLQSQRFRLIENFQLRIDNPNNSLSINLLEELHTNLEVLAEFIVENHEEMELRRFDLELRCRENNRLLTLPLLKAVSRLEELNFSHRGNRKILEISPALFAHLANATDIHLQKLRFSGISLCNVPSEDLGSVACRMEEIDFSNTDLTPAQIKTMFVRLSSGTNRLSRLDLSYNNLMMLDRDLLAKVVSGLRYWDWVSCNLCQDQIAAIVSEISNSAQLRLRSVSFNENLSHVEKDVLARAVVRLEDVKFFDNKFSSDQLDELLKAIVKLDKQLYYRTKKELI